MITLFQTYRIFVVFIAVGSIGTPCLSFQNDFFNILLLAGFLGVVFFMSLNSGIPNKERSELQYKRHVSLEKKINNNLLKIVLISIGVLYVFVASFFAAGFLFFKDFRSLPFTWYTNAPPLTLLVVFILIIPTGHYVGKKLFKEKK